MAERPGESGNTEGVEAFDQIIEWSSLENDDVGKWLFLATLHDKTIHVFGTWGGATLVLQGSNENGTPAYPVTLKDPQGNVMSFSDLDMKVLMENPKQMRPKVTGGDGTTDLTVIICGRSGIR